MGSQSPGIMHGSNNVKVTPLKIIIYIYIYTLWLFNIAMENGPFIDGLPMKNMVIFHGYVRLPEGVCIYIYILYI